MPRLIELVDTSLFGGEAVVTTFEGREGLSQHFEFFLTIDSPKPALTPADVIGKPIGFQLNRESGSPRFFHGYISHLWAGDYIASKGEQALPSRVYRIRVAPWSWFMTRAARAFVYLPEKQEKSIQDVIDRLMQHVKDYGHVNPWLDPSGASIMKNRKTEHCVQYRESDYAFLARTLERYGVYYYFRHEASKHTMVLNDKQAYPTLPEAEIDYPGSLGRQTVTPCILEWQHAYEFVSGKWSQTDYDFKQPSTSLKVEAAKNSGVSLSTNSGYELYDYPNDYVRKSDGREEALRRQEEEEVRFNTVTGRSSCVTMTPGYVFKLKSHSNARSEAGKSYMLTSVEHLASQPGRWASPDQQETYMNRFTCIPKEMQYRPTRSTPRPQLSSIQTAVVVGPVGEEIYTDEFGRVKVQFHWDREGKRDENTSCWIRVSQSHAGPGFGGIDIPRVGEEVIVSFLEGDPDRPLITGRVYHQEAMPPFGLPSEKTRSGLKTKTYKGGGYNELSMDDSPGKEQIRIHGQYNLDTVVENNETHHIKNNRTKTIDVDENNTIGKNQTLTVGVNKTVTVGSVHSENVGANQTVNVGANQSTTVGANQSNTVAVMRTHSVGANEMINVGAAQEISVGGFQAISVGGLQTISVGAAQVVSVGKSQTTTVGDKIEITCGEAQVQMESSGKITIKNSASKIELDPGGKIMIQGTDVTMQAGAGKVNIDPGGIISIKGPMVKINT
jgi:type VI secretion system secreted protein VgrG